jgi:hypothetical protein
MARWPPSQAYNWGDLTYSSAVGSLIFTLFVVAGSAYIVLAKLGGIGQAYVTFVPVAIMLAYALLIWFARNLRLRDDQAGDNLYYMGFLFTLTSLGVSLYQFTATRAAEEIVQNFGIAIGSTITGIALRVIFNQMRHDPVEIERTMRLELAESARRVRRELDSTVVEFGYVRRSAHQAAADSFKLVAERFDEVAGRLLASVTDISLKSAQPLEAASRRSAAVVEQLTDNVVGALAASTQRLADETGKLSNSTGEISATLDKVTAKLANMRTPDAVVEVRLEPVIQSLTQSLTEAIDRFVAHSEGHAAAIRDIVGAAKAAAESSSDSIVALRQEIASNSATNGAILERATKIITATAQIVDEFEASARTQVEVLRQLLERTDGTIRAFSEAFRKSGNDMALESGGVKDVLHAMQASVQTLATVSERMAGIAEDIGARRSETKWEAIK